MTSFSKTLLGRGFDELLSHIERLANEARSILEPDSGEESTAKCVVFFGDSYTINYMNSEFEVALKENSRLSKAKVKALVLEKLEESPKDLYGLAHAMRNALTEDLAVAVFFVVNDLRQTWSNTGVGAVSKTFEPDWITHANTLVLQQKPGLAAVLNEVEISFRKHLKKSGKLEISQYQLDSKIAGYLAAVVDCVAANPAGYELWRLDYVPDLGDDFTDRLENNWQVLSDISNPKQPSAPLDEILASTGLARDSENVYERIRQIVSSPEAIIAPGKWLPALMNRKDLAELTFDKWSFDVSQDLIKSLSVVSFLDSKGKVKSSSKLVQPGGPHTALFKKLGSKNNGVKVEWVTDPETLLDSYEFHLKVLPVNSEALVQIGDLGTKVVKFDKRSATVDVNLDGLDDEEKDFALQQKYHVEVSSSPGMKIAYSEEFYLRLDSVGSTDYKNKESECLTFSMARLDYLTKVENLDNYTLKFKNPGQTTYEFSNGLKQNTNVVISWNVQIDNLVGIFMEDIETAISGLVDLGTSHYEGGLDLANSCSKNIHRSIPHALASARARVLNGLKVVEPGARLEAISEKDWEGLMPLIDDYSSEYLGALKNATSNEQKRDLLSIDTVKLSRKIGNKISESILMLPIHPLKLAWFTEYVRVFRRISDELERLPLKNRSSSIDLDQLNLVTPSLTPLINYFDSRYFVNSSQVGFTSTLFMAVGEVGQSRELDFFLTLLNGPAKKPQDKRLIKSITDKIYQYRITHQLMNRVVMFITSEQRLSHFAAAIDNFYKNIQALVAKERVPEHLEEVVPPRIAISVGGESNNHLYPIQDLVELQQTLIEGANWNLGSELLPSFEISSERQVDITQQNQGVNLVIANEAGMHSISPVEDNWRTPTYFYGLVSSIGRKFNSSEEYPAVWENLASSVPIVEGVPTSTRHLSDLFEAYAGVVSELFAGDGRNVGVTYSLGADEIIEVERLHRISDWVLTVQKYSGAELFDSPNDEILGRRSRKYILDYVPTGTVGEETRVVVSTTHQTELRNSLKAALVELGIGDSELTAEMVLEDLRRVSGRIVGRLASIESGFQSVTSEAVGIAIVSKFLKRQNGNPLANSIIIPVDDHLELFKGKAEGERCDLIIFYFEESHLLIECVEIKRRRSPAHVKNRLLLEKISRQTSITRRFVENTFFNENRLDLNLIRGSLSNLLLGYLDRNRRYRSIDDDTYLRLRDNISSMEYANSPIRFRETGYIVCLDYEGQKSFEIDGATIHVLTNNETESIGIESEQSIQTKLASVTSTSDTPPSAAPIADLEPKPQAPTSGALVVNLPPRTDVENSVGEVTHIDSKEAGVVVTIPDVVKVNLGVISETGTEASMSMSTIGSPHSFILGMPGQGKSWTILRILQQFQTIGLPSLIFDYHGQFSRSLKSNFKRLDIATGLDFSPFDPGSLDYKITSLQIADIFCHVVDLGDMQRDLVYRALKVSYENCGYGSDRSKSLPTIEAFFSELEILEEKTGVRNASARLRPLLDFNIFAAQPEADFADLYKGAIVDFSKIPVALIQDAAGAFILRKLFMDMTTWGKTDKLRLAIVLDEAHRLSKDITLPKLMKEGRKFGIVIIVASQNNKDFHEDVLQNAGTKIVFRLNAGESKKAAGFLSSRAGVDLRSEIERLSVGEAIIQTPEMNQARRVKMHPFEE